MYYRLEAADTDVPAFRKFGASNRIEDRFDAQAARQWDICAIFFSDTIAFSSRDRHGDYE